MSQIPPDKPVHTPQMLTQVFGDLQHALKTGKPIRKGQLPSDRRCNLARLAWDMDADEDLYMGRGFDVASSAKGEVETIRQRMRKDSQTKVLGQYKATVVNPELPERVYAGKSTSLDTSAHFALLDRGPYFELVPISHWVNFRLDSEVAEEDLEAFERKQKLKLKLEKNANDRFMKFVKTTPASMTDHPDEEPEQGVKHALAKKKKRLKKRRVEKDNEDHGNSALNLGHLTKDDGDWEWEDGDATDDEEGVDPELLPPPPEEHEVEDSEEDDEELMPYGQAINKALENQQNQEADDELAQFSDSEEEKADTPAESATPPPSNSADAPQYELVKQRVQRTLQSAGGRINIRDFMVKFKVKEKNAQFRILQKVLSDICTTDTERDAQGNVVKMLQLRPD
ncbi:MAG: uncharacterized protein KVP18_000657 [Porospora cf. gigantea A]|uniref:uncharacterized protein n=1 Tax=Porospora cf. gigantea A TaxID=2853593 RepID=UPI00355A675E|nr:MAG: hypothetical protein KVP18_000657 [Porospora cf. gigantea A]